MSFQLEDEPKTPTHSKILKSTFSSTTVEMTKWEELLSNNIKEYNQITSSGKKENRTPFQRDFDKVIFSSIFRRLSDKTQVFPMSTNASIHTRLTHSLEVSAVGKSLSRKISEWLIGNEKINSFNINDIEDIVSTSCLIHDIGNPPFGHAGEDAV
jgi:dGTPase